jgi:hypothetical protein
MFRNKTESSNFFPIWIAAIVAVAARLWNRRRR